MVEVKPKSELVRISTPEGDFNVRKVRIRKYRECYGYYKVTLMTEKSNYSIRFATKLEVLRALNNTGTYKENFRCVKPDGKIVKIYYIFGRDEYCREFDLSSLHDEILNDEFAESEHLQKIAKGDKVKADPVKAVPHMPIKKCENKKETNVKGDNMFNFNVINGVITFDKAIAFNIDGKYKYVDANGCVREVLPQFVMVRDVPALVPTIADKVTKGSYYKANGTLYNALDDNKVIDLNTGIISNICISSIPLGDGVIVYKPVMSANGKINMKDIMMAQMLGQASADGATNPMMLMAMMGDGDVDFKQLALMGMLGVNGGMGDANNLLPLFLFSEDKEEGSSMEDFFLLQSMQGQGTNSLLPYLLLKDKKKAKKADAKTE